MKMLISAIENATGKIEIARISMSNNISESIMYRGFPRNDGWSYYFDVYFEEDLEDDDYFGKIDG
jgi:hypothetical protein